MDASDERHLLNSLGGGNDAAFWRLWRQHRPHLAEICARMMTASDAEDALSRSMLLAQTKLPTYARDIVNLEAWLTRLAGNVCRDMLREQRRTPDALPLDGGRSAPAEMLADGHCTPEDEYVLLEIRVSVETAIAALPVRLRSAATLYFLEELGYPAVAEQLQITNENARKRVQQARALLRDELTPLFR